ncbi:MAG: MmcQ/YjbR family DNA-binding protein [Ilumatobacteraceae bacterium]
MGKQTAGTQASTSIDRLTEICRDLPECEIEGDQHHKLSVAGRTIGWHTVDHHGDGRISLSVRAPKGENEALVASDPDTFFMPPYVAQHGYVGIYLDRPKVDWDEVREFVTDAYILVAPKRLSKLVR